MIARGARLAALLCLTGILSACYERVEIPVGHYGVRTYLGQPVEIVAGPGALRTQPLLEQVVIFPRAAEITVASAGGDPIRLSLEVTDPKNFYRFAAGRFEGLSKSLERKTKTLPKAEAIALLLKKLNDPATGVAAKIL